METKRAMNILSKLALLALVLALDPGRNALAAEETSPLDVPEESLPPAPPATPSDSAQGDTPPADSTSLSDTTRPPGDEFQNRSGQREWYGWQLMGVDALTIVLSVGMTPYTPSDTGLRTYAASYLFSSPIIHLSHKNWLGAAGSLGARATLPVVGFLIGSSSGSCSQTSSVSGGSFGFSYGSCFGRLLGGSLLGVLSAYIVDYAVLSREPAPRQPIATMPAKPRRAITLQSVSLAHTKEQSNLMVALTF